jgi:hypothetical protein
MKEGHIQNIKTKGYWRINFKPVTDVVLDPLLKCKELVEQNSLHLTGWDYPHISARNDDTAGIDIGNNYYQGWIEWLEYGHVEFWRMYQSSQFINYFGLVEDWNPMIYRSMWESEDIVGKAGELLGVTRSTYFLTQVFQFLAGLARSGLYEHGVDVDISLHNTRGRSLIVDHYSRIGFSVPKKTDADEIVIPTQHYTKTNLIDSPNDLALKNIEYIFERFGWSPPNIEVIKLDQENLVKGKI